MKSLIIISWNPFLIILLVLFLPFYIWVVGFFYASFYIPFFKEDEAKDFLEAHGCEFVKCEEIKNDGSNRLEESLINRIYLYKTYYQIYAQSISDRSEKKIRLILKKTYFPFNSKRELYFFEQ